MSSFTRLSLSMDYNRNIKILVWNIRGINSQEKWDAIRAKITESACHILCLQETKREHFDSFYLKKFCPRHLDRFHFSPSSGAAGGLITIWNSSFFKDSLVQANSYAITIKFDCSLNNNSFHSPMCMDLHLQIRNMALLLGSLTWTNLNTMNGF